MQKYFAVAGIILVFSAWSRALVGNSMGAGVALFTAVHFPQVVDRIVLADGGGYRAAVEKADEFNHFVRGFLAKPRATNQ